MKRASPGSRGGTWEHTHSRDGWGSPGDKVPGTRQLRDFCCNLTKEMLFTGKRVFWGRKLHFKVKGKKMERASQGAHLCARRWRRQMSTWVPGSGAGAWAAPCTRTCQGPRACKLGVAASQLQPHPTRKMPGRLFFAGTTGKKE